jgi:hypothetical protein
MGPFLASHAVRSGADRARELAWENPLAWKGYYGDCNRKSPPRCQYLPVRPNRANGDQNRRAEYQSMAERRELGQGARQLKAVAEALPDSPISDPPEHHFWNDHRVHRGKIETCKAIRAKHRDWSRFTLHRVSLARATEDRGTWFKARQEP